MSDRSTIEWTEATWNPVTGCTKISPGCKFCYAERMAHRLQAMGKERYRNGFKLTEQPDALSVPLRWKRPRMIFVNSMSDLFHKNVSTSYIRECFSVMETASQHTYQVLTKRPDRVLELATTLPWPRNIWIGTSVENADYLWRVESIRDVPAHVHFLSIEPLLGPIPNLPLESIEWVIVGGESGPQSREMKEEWAVEIRDQCLAADVPFFFKQWGGRNKKASGRRLRGDTWSQMPRISGERPDERHAENGLENSATHAGKARDSRAVPASVVPNSRKVRHTNAARK